MSSIGPTSATNVQPAATTTPAAPVTPTAQPNGSAPAFNPPPLKSASGEIIPTRKASIAGLSGTPNRATGTANRFAREVAFDTYTGVGSSPVARGFIRCEATAIPGGCRLNVQSFHSAKHDKLSLYLVAEVLDQKSNQMRTVVLSVLSKDEDLNGDTFRGNTYFDISYDEVNKFLAARNPNLKITPGLTTLAISAVYGSGHNAGGFSRGGTFRLPAAATPLNVVSVRTSAAAKDSADLPLDMQVAYPPTLTQQVPSLKPDGNIVSRLESEYKGTASGNDMRKAIREMYKLAEAAAAGNKKEVEKVLGNDWTIETVNRYWLKDDGSGKQPGKAGSGFFAGFRVDEHDLPIQDPMKDTYMDDGNLAMTRHEGAIRLRTNKQATMINVKPGGGRRDAKSGIVQRIEVGLELKPDSNTSAAAQALRSLASGTWAGTVFNHAQKEVHKLDNTLNLSSTLNPWLDIVQSRHKFTVKNEKTGVEIEFSLDEVHTKTVRPEHAKPDGSPREAEFFVLEAELDHLQLASANKSTYALANGQPQTGTFNDDTQQDTWLKATSDKVTMDIEPRLHELRDLDNESFRQTSSYKSFTEAVKKLIPSLFPNGLGVGHQKAAHAAEVLGLVFLDDKKLLGGLEEMVKESGYQWNQATEQAFTTAISDATRRRNLEAALVQGQGRNLPNLVRSYVANAALEYDVAAMKKRVAGTLAQAGLKSNAQVDAMLDQLTAAKLNPLNFESYLANIQSQRQAQVFAQMASSLGVSPAPVPDADLKKLFGDSLYGEKIAAALERHSADAAQQGEIEKFYSEAAQKGADIWEIRNNINSLVNSPQTYLQQLAQAHSITAPTLHASAGKLVEAAERNMQSQHLKANDALKTMMKKVADTRNLQEALSFVQTLGNDAPGVLAKEAARLGISAPKLSFDFATIDTLMQTAATNAKIAYDDGLKKLVHTCVEGGVPVAQLQRLIQQLANASDLATASRQVGVYLVGVSLPKVSYDIAATEAWIRQGMSTFAPHFAGGNALAKFTEELFKQGVTPSQAYNYVNNTLIRGKQNAQAYLQGLAASNLPDVPIDVDSLCRNWQQRWNAAWTPEVEKYVKSAFVKAQASPTFVLNQILNANVQSIVATVAQHSGVARPAGV